MTTTTATRRVNPVQLGALLFVAFAIALTWLVFPYFVQGQQLLRGVGDQAATRDCLPESPGVCANWIDTHQADDPRGGALPSASSPWQNPASRRDRRGARLTRREERE